LPPVKKDIQWTPNPLNHHLCYGLDLAHSLVGFFLPAGGIILMAVAGPLYLVWFPLVGRDLFRLSCSQS
jgi:hypothetical protein